MSAQRIEYGKNGQPHSVNATVYRIRMDLKKIVAANVGKIVAREYGKIITSRFGKESGISTAGAQRVLGKVETKEGVSLGLLGRVAEWAQIEPWRLLTPDLDVESAEAQFKLSAAERELVEAFRDIPEDSQEELLHDVLELAQKSRRHVEKILKERFGVEGHVDPERAAKHLPPAPPYDYQIGEAQASKPRRHRPKLEPQLERAAKSRKVKR